MRSDIVTLRKRVSYPKYGIDVQIRCPSSRYPRRWIKILYLLHHDAPSDGSLFHLWKEGHYSGQAQSKWVLCRRPRPGYEIQIRNRLASHPYCTRNDSWRIGADDQWGRMA